MEDYQQNHPAPIPALHMYVHRHMHPQTVTMRYIPYSCTISKKTAFGKQLLEKSKETFSACITKLISLLIWWQSIFPHASSLSTHNPEIHWHCHLLDLLDPTEMSLAIVWQVIIVRNTSDLYSYTRHQSVSQDILKTVYILLRNMLMQLENETVYILLRNLLIHLENKTVYFLLRNMLINFKRTSWNRGKEVSLLEKKINMKMKTYDT